MGKPRRMVIPPRVSAPRRNGKDMALLQVRPDRGVLKDSTPLPCRPKDTSRCQQDAFRGGNGNICGVQNVVIMRALPRLQQLCSTNLAELNRRSVNKDTCTT